MKINVNLPEIKGSAKQIAWAEDIRATALKEIEECVERWLKNDCKETAYVIAKEAEITFAEVTSAREWIDSRYDGAESVARMGVSYMKQAEIEKEAEEAVKAEEEAAKADDPLYEAKEELADTEERIATVERKIRRHEELGKMEEAEKLKGRLNELMMKKAEISAKIKDASDK